MKANAAPVPVANGAPFLVTAQASGRPAAVSTGDGSVADPARGRPCPRRDVVTGAAMAGVGGRLATAIVSVVVPTPPSLSVAVRVTTYVPLSLGVKMKLAPDAAAYAAPFLVAAQARVRPAAVSAALGSVADPPRLMAVPSVAVVIGAPMVGRGGDVVGHDGGRGRADAAVLVGGRDGDGVRAVVVRA